MCSVTMLVTNSVAEKPRKTLKNPDKSPMKVQQKELVLV